MQIYLIWWLTFFHILKDKEPFCLGKWWEKITLSLQDSLCFRSSCWEILHDIYYGFQFIYRIIAHRETSKHQVYCNLPQIILIQIFQTSKVRQISLDITCAHIYTLFFLLVSIYFIIFSRIFQCGLGNNIYRILLRSFVCYMTFF